VALLGGLGVRNLRIQPDPVVDSDAAEEEHRGRVVAHETRKNEAGESSPTYKKGAVLLVLKQEGSRLLTTWKDVQPSFEGCASGTTCWQKEP
jgi:hypothetical protein